MDLNATWFLLVGVLLIGYAILDGFDLGVGVLSLFRRDLREKRILMNAIGPVWDGNEVWLITGGGALFAAFPPVYATVFSGFYLALFLLLTALILRAVSLEFHGKILAEQWRRFWSLAFGLGSLLPAVLFGVALGNIIRGVPIDAGGMWAGTFLGLLNPYAILIGIFSLVTLVMHGALYLTMKTEGELQKSMTAWAVGGWAVFIILWVIVTFWTVFAAPHVFQGITSKPLFWILLILLLASIILIPIRARAGRYFSAFLASSLAIACLLGLTAVGLYPRIVPSSLGLDYSLTAYNASSSALTLKTMLIIALIGMPLVIAYTTYVYTVFKGKVKLEEGGY